MYDLAACQEWNRLFAQGQEDAAKAYGRQGVEIVKAARGRVRLAAQDRANAYALGTFAYLTDRLYALGAL